MAPELPRRPELPATSPEKATTSRGRFFIVLFCGFSLLTILAFISLFYVGFAVVLGLIVLMVLFHYVVWGWWLGGIIRQAEADQDSGNEP